MTKKRHHLRSVVAIAICLAAVVISSGCCKMDSVEDERIFGMSYHDNAVTVETTANKLLGNLADPLFSPTFRAEPWTITGGVFTLTNFDVTLGQDPNHNLLIGEHFLMDSKNNFVFTVGRKGSKEVAASFNQACPPEHNTFSSVTITLFDPYKSGYETFDAFPPEYNGHGFISPIEDPNLVFLFKRGTSSATDLFYHNIVYIIGVYQRTP